jgi:hypothetical protein
MQVGKYKTTLLERKKLGSLVKSNKSLRSNRKVSKKIGVKLQACTFSEAIKLKGAIVIRKKESKMKN